MGREERERKAKQKELARLATTDPQAFNRKWAERVDTWTGQIHSTARKGMIKGEKTFSKVDRARQYLTKCGEAAVALQLHETTEILNNECCRALAQHSSDKLRSVKIYEINEKFEAHGKYRLSREDKARLKLRKK